MLTFILFILMMFVCINTSLTVSHHFLLVYHVLTQVVYLCLYLMITHIHIPQAHIRKVSDDVIFSILDEQCVNSVVNELLLSQVNAAVEDSDVETADDLEIQTDVTVETQPETIMGNAVMSKRSILLSCTTV